MNDNEKIDFLIDTCKKRGQGFPHTLIVAEDLSIARRVIQDVASKLEKRLVIVDGSSLGSPSSTVITTLKNDELLLIEDMQFVNSAYFSCLTDLFEFKYNLKIDSGTSVRFVDVKLNKFTIIGSVPRINLVPSKLLSSFFCIVQGEALKNINKEIIYNILQREFGNVVKEVADYANLLLEKNRMEIDGFSKNLVKFMELFNYKRKDGLTKEIVKEYFNMHGVANFKIRDITSRQVSGDVQREVWRRDQGRCVICQSQERLEYDHVIPFSKGGSNTARNIQLLCESCNREKGAQI